MIWPLGVPEVSEGVGGARGMLGRGEDVVTIYFWGVKLSRCVQYRVFMV